MKPKYWSMSGKEYSWLKNYFLPLFGFYIVAFLVVYSLNVFDVLSTSIKPVWDIEHYKWIADNCYCDFRLVFFPGFSWFWRLTGVGLVGISIINGLIYIISSSYLGFLIKAKPHGFLILSTIFSSIFFFLPYSESLFYLFVSIGIYGILSHNSFIVIGFSFASITRSASTLFTVASISSIISWRSGKIRLESIENRKKIITIILTSISAIGFIALLNYLESGDPFSFYKYQSIWENRLSFPSLPLRSWGSGIAHQFDFMAIGFILVFSLYFLKHWKSVALSLLLKYSILYLLGFTLLTLAFRGGSLHSYNRFIFCSPFFLVAFDSLLKNQKITLRAFVEILLLLLLLSLLFASYVHIQVFLKYLAASFYSIILIIAYSKKSHSVISFLILIVNLALFLLAYTQFYQEIWIG